MKWNFALDRAVEWARKYAKPLVILEALRCDYPWANDRFHRFVLDGMREKTQEMSRSVVHYYPYVEPRAGAGKGLLAAAALRACAVVTDDFPGYFHPRMIQSAARQSLVRLEAVDSNGLLPLRAANRAFTTAYSFRRFLQKSLPAHLASFPKRDPLASLELPPLKSLSKEIAEEWPPTSAGNLSDPIFLAHLPVNHRVGAVSIQGGEAAATKALRKFLRDRVDEYSAERN
jgi:deoxyribodipyrimidine photo-lyase